MKILCLGNGDNLGVRVFSWLEESSGQEVFLYRLTVDEDEYRGNPFFYLPEDRIKYDKKIKKIDYSLKKIRWSSLLGDSLINYINKSFDCVLITGGWHALIYSRKINLPKIFIFVGYEIHYMANKVINPKIKEWIFNFRGVLREKFYLRLTKSALRRVDKIVDSFPYTINILNSIGLKDKILYMSTGEDILKNRLLINQKLLLNLNKITSSSKRVFLWLSRLNFKKKDNITYKGADIFIEGLSEFKDSIIRREVCVIIGYHGEDCADIKEMTKKIGINEHIKWVSHLDYSDLLSYLSIKNGVLFTELGDLNSGISGIGRDGYSLGIPMVNSTLDKVMEKQFLKPGPRFYAKNKENVVDAINYFFRMNEFEYNLKREESRFYGENYIHKNNFSKRIMDELSKLVG